MNCKSATNFNQFNCGLFGISDEYTESYLSLDEKFLQNKESTFIVKARGDSMEPKILCDDFLIVDKSVKLQPGDVATFYYNNQAICKQYIKIQNKIILRSFNSKYSDIIVKGEDRFELFAVVIGLARSLK